MDPTLIKAIFGLGIAHIGVLITILVKFWTFAANQAVKNYQHDLMWNRFKKEFLDASDDHKA